MKTDTTVSELMDSNQGEELLVTEQTTYFFKIQLWINYLVEFLHYFPWILC